MNITIIGCGKTKLAHAAPAKDLYTGSLFRASRKWAEAQGGPWFILSAAHGIVSPDIVIEPYDTTLADIDAKVWARDVCHSIVSLCAFHRAAFVTLLAGAEYADPLDACPVILRQPLRGKQIGERLAWLAGKPAAPARPETLAALVLDVDKASPGAATAEMVLPADVWARMVALARAA